MILKNYVCSCGNTLYFENSECLNCHKPVGFVPTQLLLSDFVVEGKEWIAQHPALHGMRFRPCQNYTSLQVCNWMVRADDPNHYCISCRHNRVIPNLSEPKNTLLWSRIEQAKRRCLYTLIELGLTFDGYQEDPARGLAFEFMEDTEVKSEFYDTFYDGQRILSGHINGTITINIAEADPSAREEMREIMQELYRTILGHFRHEIGHYFWMRLIEKSEWLEKAREVFGDERENYSTALSNYYAVGPKMNWTGTFISGYASAHPWEDWAETWAHYMHMVDTLETAENLGVTINSDTESKSASSADDDFTAMIRRWKPLTTAMNSLNRSLGLPDAYPFYLSDQVIRKLHFIHRVINNEGTDR